MVMGLAVTGRSYQVGFEVFGAASLWWGQSTCCALDGYRLLHPSPILLLPDRWQVLEDALLEVPVGIGIQGHDGGVSQKAGLLVESLLTLHADKDDLFHRQLGDRPLEDSPAQAPLLVSRINYQIADEAQIISVCQGATGTDEEILLPGTAADLAVLVGELKTIGILLDGQRGISVDL